jgi:ABC-type multidrug transport system fused ATPase/permease subunit
MSRRTKQSPRIVAPVVVDLDLRSQEDDGYEFDDMSRRTSSKERDGFSRGLQDEETVPDDNNEIKRVPIEEIEESQDSQRPARRQQPARLGYRTRSDPIVIDMKAPEDTGFEFRDISYTTPKGTTLLKNVSATVAKGEMLAIMVCPTT